MARVRNSEPDELPADLVAIHRDFCEGYGPFRNQAAVFSHVPSALRHLVAMLDRAVPDWGAGPRRAATIVRSL